VQVKQNKLLVLYKKSKYLYKVTTIPQMKLYDTTLNKLSRTRTSVSDCSHLDHGRLKERSPVVPLDIPLVLLAVMTICCH
jgi:hypothetical protein